jgi:hypothetical protein
MKAWPARTKFVAYRLLAGTHPAFVEPSQQAESPSAPFSKAAPNLLEFLLHLGCSLITDSSLSRARTHQKS